MEKSCRTCAYLEVPPDKDGKVRRRADKCYRCLAPIPPVPDDMPDSITRRHGYYWPTNQNKSYMSVDGGATCGAWKWEVD